MIKKYIPYILLLAAGFLFFYIKKHQRGPLPQPQHSSEVISTEHYPAENASVINNDSFNRHTTHLIFSKHARCRTECRHIDETEVKEILEIGILNSTKIEASEKGKSYPLEGFTHDKQHVRIVFAPKNESLIVVTVIDLDNEWPCDCK